MPAGLEGSSTGLQAKVTPFNKRGRLLHEVPKSCCVIFGASAKKDHIRLREYYNQNEKVVVLLYSGGLDCTYKNILKRGFAKL